MTTTISVYVSDPAIENWWLAMPTRERSKTLCDLIRTRIASGPPATNNDILMQVLSIQTSIEQLTTEIDRSKKLLELLRPLEV